MKKILHFAVIIAALTACAKMDPKDGQTMMTEKEGIPFNEGENVTLTVSVSGKQTKVEGSLNSSGEVEFIWKKGDCIKVTVNDKSSIFSLKSGDGTGSATFSGYMPASGTTFNAQYPVDVPDLSNQTYSANSLPTDKMLATATDCTLNSGFSLVPQYSAIRLNIYGNDKTVGKIVITNTSAEDPKPSYTLNCGEGVTVSSDPENPTAFLLVVDPGNYGFKADVFKPGSPSGKLIAVSTSSPKGITGGNVINMPDVFLKYSGSNPADAQ